MRCLKRVSGSCIVRLDFDGPSVQPKCPEPRPVRWNRDRLLILRDDNTYSHIYTLTPKDRHERMKGNAPGTLPVVDEDPTKPSALPTPDSFVFFNEWSKKSVWKNEVTVRS